MFLRGLVYFFCVVFYVFGDVDERRADDRREQVGIDCCGFLDVQGLLLPFNYVLLKQVSLLCFSFLAKFRIYCTDKLFNCSWDRLAIDLTPAF